MVQATHCLARTRFYGFMRTMKLKNKVRTTRKATSGTTCSSEMSAMMSCWRSNNFEDVPCSKEIQLFLECARKVHADPDKYKSKGRYEWTSDQVNERLRRFVWPQ